MIKSFRCKDTEHLFTREETARFASIARVALRKLRYLHAANKLSDLKAPPGNQLEALKGDRAGQYSIRVNDQFRLCFRFLDGAAYEVEIVDYH